jgi:hypothetical protein
MLILVRPHEEALRGVVRFDDGATSPIKTIKTAELTERIQTRKALPPLAARRHASPARSTTLWSGCRTSCHRPAVPAVIAGAAGVPPVATSTTSAAASRILGRCCFYVVSMFGPSSATHTGNACIVFSLLSARRIHHHESFRVKKA